MEQEQILTELIEYDALIKEYKKKLDSVKTKVKDMMISQKIETITHKGNLISLRTSERKTPTKDILTKLHALGLTSCIKTEIVPDIDRLSLEVGVGITQEQYEQLVKVTEVKTMTIK